MYTVIVMLATVAAQPAQPKSVLPPFAEEAIKPSDTDTPLRKLQKQRVRERATAIARTNEVIKIGQFDVSFYQQYTQTQAALAENLAELMEKAEDKAKCYEMRVEAMQAMEKFIAALVEAGRMRPQDLNLARAARMDAEIDLLKFKEKFAVGLPEDAEGLLRASIVEITALADAVDKKEPIEKLRARALKLKATTEKLDGLTLSKESRAALDAKYRAELQEATARLLKAAVDNPDSFKLVEEALRK